MGTADQPKRVFISYSHDSDAHSARVLVLAQSLRRHGIEVELDQYHNEEIVDWPRWCNEQISPTHSDFVLCVCTGEYRRRIEGNVPPERGKGVYWEGSLIDDDLYDAKGNGRFIPVLFDSEPETSLPRILRGWTRCCLGEFTLNDPGYEHLLRTLTGQSRVTKEPLGQVPRLASSAVPAGASSSPNPTPRISISRLPVTGELLIGRDDELNQLDATWEQANVLSIVAPGGIGKSSLVNHWLDRLQQDSWRGAACVYGWSFYSQGVKEDGEASADTFVAETLKWFGDPDPQAGTAHERGLRLAEFVRSQRTLLILDGIEPMQYPPGPNAGRLKDPALQALVRELAVHNPGLCIITTREPVTDVKGRTGVKELDLRKLTVAAGAELLKVLGTDGTATERRHVAREFGGHALTLSLLGKYLVEAHGGDLRKHHDVLLLNPDTELGVHAGHVLLAYENWLGADSPEVGYLRILGLFDRPASAGCLAALLADPAIPHLTDALLAVSSERRNQALSRLHSLGLVSAGSPSESHPSGGSDSEGLPSGGHAHTRSAEASGRLPRERGTQTGLDAHPLIREYFSQRLRSSHPDAYREGHRRLYESLTETTDHQPDTLERLQPLYQAVRHGCEAGMHQQACDDVYKWRILRGNEKYSWRKLGAFGADLGAVACFFTQPWSKLSPNLSEPDQAWLLNEAAFSLRALGRLTEALEPMRVSGEMDRDVEEWEGAAASYDNLSELELTLGLVTDAVKDGAQAVEFADQSGEWGMKMIMRTTHADALHQAGERDEARQLFEQAEAMQAECQPEYPRLYSLSGFQYCDLLLGEAERLATRWSVVRGPWSVIGEESGEGDRVKAVLVEVRERAEGAQRAWREIFTNAPSLLNIALDHLTLGRVALYEAVLTHSPLATCHSALDVAVKGLRDAGTVEFLVHGLLTRSWERFVVGDEEGCRADLDEAWEIAERGEMRLHMADILLYRARFFNDRDALNQAAELINETGYHRRDGELQDLEEALG